MQRAAKKRTAARSAALSSKQAKARKPAEKVARAAARSDTKQSAAIVMLRSPGGATIASLTKATGWQPHSVRGFLAGVVTKRLKLRLESAVVDGIRSYRVTGENGVKAVNMKPGRSKA